MPRKRVLRPEVLSLETLPVSTGQERSSPATLLSPRGEDRSLPMIAEDKVRELVESFFADKTAQTRRAYQKDLDDFRAFVDAAPENRSNRKWRRRFRSVIGVNLLTGGA